MSQGFTKNVIIPLPLAVSSGGTGVTTSTGTGSVVLNNVPNIIGVTNGSDAVAGSVGEYISAIRLPAATLPLTSSVIAEVTSIVLTPGDWDVRFGLTFFGATTTNVTLVRGGYTTTSATLPSTTDSNPLITYIMPPYVPQPPGSGLSMSAAPGRQNVTVNTPIFLNALAIFTVSTFSVYGWISARRIR